MRFPSSGIRGENIGECGFTLIEVLIAMSIFTIGFLALAGLQVGYTRSNASARMQTESTALAADFLARLRILPFDHRDLDPSANPHQPPARSSGPYTVQWRVTAHFPINGTKTVSITIVPQNRTFSRPVRMNTIIAD